MPTDMSNYPDNWKTEIRPAILKRATGEDDIARCEWCGVPNHQNLWRHPSDDLSYITGNAEDGKRWYGEDYKNMAVFVRLTIAHIKDPDPMNCDFNNLAALCEACHNRHDAKMRVMNKVRNKNKQLEAQGQLRLFEMTE